MPFNCCRRGLWTALWLVMIASGRAQVPTNVLRRVLLIRVGDSTGSSFTLDVGDRQYLITAKHVLGGLVGNASIQVYQEGSWQSLAVRVLDSESAADIAVMAPAKQLTVSFPLEPGSGLAFAGQDAYFVGFPYGLRIEGTTLNGLYPLPFIKKGVISAFDSIGPVKMIFLDRINNPGLSGAPIVFHDLNQPGDVFRVAGVISGFKVADSITVKVAGVSTTLPLNTGIIDGVDINYALTAIAKNPVGAKLTY